jgi:hypothetical protein
MSICDQQKPVNKKDPQFFFSFFTLTNNLYMLEEILNY